MNRDFVALNDFTSEDLTNLLNLADRMKKNPNKFTEALKGKTLGMIFSKNSTRTRVSFQTGIFQLGGQGLFFGANDLQLSRGESIHDTAKVLSRYIDGIMIRTYDHTDVEELAKHASIPVINGLTDYNHPCQALADMMTIRERFGKLDGLKLAYIGDGNNVTTSLMFACIKLGLNFVAISPKKYTLDPEIGKIGSKMAKDITIEFTDDIEAGLKDVNVIYGDTFTSMGQENEAKQRIKDLGPYQVNEKIMTLADKDAVYMHCLPAHRNEEVTDEVMDGPQSIVFDQAENRLHAQKAIMYTLMK